ALKRPLRIDRRSANAARADLPRPAPLWRPRAAGLRVPSMRNGTVLTLLAAWTLLPTAAPVVLAPAVVDPEAAVHPEPVAAPPVVAPLVIAPLVIAPAAADSASGFSRFLQQQTDAANAAMRKKDYAGAEKAWTALLELDAQSATALE